MNLTDKELIELRIKCVEVIALSASRAELRGEIIAIADKVWKFAIEPLVDAPQGQAKVAPKGK
jgi:hypothetical protein